MEKMRPTFKSKEWKKMELLLIVVILYHSQLMNINIPLQTIVQGNLQLLEENRNDLVKHLISKIQIQREWQQNLNELIDHQNKYNEEQHKQVEHTTNQNQTKEEKKETKSLAIKVKNKKK